MSRLPLPGYLALIAAAILPLASLRAEKPPSLSRLNAGELALRLRSDRDTVIRLRDGLESVRRFIEENDAIFPRTAPAGPRIPDREQREAAWNAWKALLDHFVALDAVGDFHESFWKLHGRDRDRSFLIANAADAARYRFALEFVDRVDHDSGLRTLLNDPVPELGIPAGSYDALKLRFLNFARAGNFAVWESARNAFDTGIEPELADAIERDGKVIWRFSKGRGESLTLKNSVRMLKRTGHKAWFPVQAGVSEFMGDTKVRRRHSTLISPDQITALKQRLEPGDILLCRSEWYLSNIGLPGFWPHAALYIGTAEDRRRYFDDPDTRSWLADRGVGDLETLLRNSYGPAWTNSTALSEGREIRVIEAISEGVSFTPLEHTAGCDSLAVLRPRLARRDKAAAILRAFQFTGRPYDFNFDFRTDSALVCTELVCKAYEPGAGKNGLRFPLVQVLGRPVTPANEIARFQAAQSGEPDRPCDFITFMDGEEKQRRAVERGESEFVKSWQRPKWHILTQK
jgi:hypothetical protein